MGQEISIPSDAEGDSLPSGLGIFIAPSISEKEGDDTPVEDEDGDNTSSKPGDSTSPLTPVININDKPVNEEGDHMSWKSGDSTAALTSTMEGSIQKAVDLRSESDIITSPSTFEKEGDDIPVEEHEGDAPSIKSDSVLSFSSSTSEEEGNILPTEQGSETGINTLDSTSEKKKNTLNPTVKRTQTPRRVHQMLYARSIHLQEEGRRRRYEIEDKLHRLAAERNGDFARSTRSSSRRNQGQDRLTLQRKKNAERRKNMTREFEKQSTSQKITLDQANDLYTRLVSHKTRVEEKMAELKKERKERDSKRISSSGKISTSQASLLYYRSTVSSRTRSRGRASSPTKSPIKDR